MSGLDRTIVIDASIEAALATIAKLNTTLDTSNQKAEGVGKSLDSGFKNASNGPKGFGDTLSSLGGKITSVGKAVGLMLGSVGVAIHGIESGLGDLDKGLKKYLYDTQSGASAASNAISDLTNGILDNGNAAEMLRKGRGLGITDDQIGKIAKLGTNYGLMSESGNAAAGAMTLLESVAKGRVKAIYDLNPALARMISMDEQFKAATTDSAKSQAALNYVMKNYDKILEDTGNVSDTTFGRMIGLITKLKDLTEGLLPMLTGMGKIAGSLLLPLVAGAGIGFIRRSNRWSHWLSRWWRSLCWFDSRLPKTW